MGLGERVRVSNTVIGAFNSLPEQNKVRYHGQLKNKEQLVVG